MIAGPTATPRGREGDLKTAGPIDTQRPRGVVCYTQLWPTGLLSGTGIVGAEIDVDCHLVMGPCRSRGTTWTQDPPVLSSGTHVTTWTRWDLSVLSGGTTVAVERHLAVGPG